MEINVKMNKSRNTSVGAIEDISEQDRLSNESGLFKKFADKKSALV
jgi:hypothetical protein